PCLYLHFQRYELFGRFGRRLARDEEISNNHDRTTEHPGHPAAGLAYQNLGRSSDATHWLFDTLRDWQRRKEELTGAQLPDAARHRDHLRRTRGTSAA